MADGRDNRNLRLKDCPRHYFFIERPEIFDGAAATADKNHVDIVPGTEVPDPCGDFMRRPRPLDIRRIDQNMQGGISPFQNSKYVPDCSPRRRGYNADFLRQERERLLVRLIE